MQYLKQVRKQEEKKFFKKNKKEGADTYKTHAQQIKK